MTHPRNEVKEILGPGAWIDMENNLHFSLPDILKHLGIADTSENRAELEEELKQITLRRCPGAKITVREKPD